MELCLSQLLLEVFVFSPLHPPTIIERILGDSVCVVWVCGGGFFSGVLCSYSLI